MFDHDVPKACLSSLKVQLSIFGHRGGSAEVFAAHASRTVVHRYAWDGLRWKIHFKLIGLKEMAEVKSTLGNHMPFAAVSWQQPSVANWFW